MQSQSKASFVILAETGEQGRSVARSLVKLGYPNAFAMSGGWEAWTAAGLSVSDQSVYDLSPVNALSSKVRDLTNTASAASLLLPVIGMTVWTVLHYRYLLQMMGILGPIASLTVYLMKTYDTPMDFLEDMDQRLKSGDGQGTAKASQTIPVASRIPQQDSREIQPAQETDTSQ